jgi:uncharacterized radical SAM superfamily Fe-S cluster-containing enzyme
VVEALVYEDGGCVYISKSCPQHGEYTDIYWSDYELYRWAEKWEVVGNGVSSPQRKREKGCPYDCGLCENHKTCTVLGIIDVTNRCNLNCPICFAHAGAVGYLYEPSSEQVKQMLKNLRSVKPIPPTALQYSGGEPTLRKDLPELVAMAKEEGFRHVEVNSNGIVLAKNLEYYKSLLDAGTSTVYLQFDGLTDDIYVKTRGIPLLDLKLKVIENARKLKHDSIVLVVTLVRGVNDHQVGDIVKFAAKNCDVVRGVNVQPVSITGRINREEREKMRITIPDFMKLYVLDHELVGFGVHVYRVHLDVRDLLRYDYRERPDAREHVDHHLTGLDQAGYPGPLVLEPGGEEGLRYVDLEDATALLVQRLEPSRAG